MDESVTDDVRRQSILKSRTRFPLQEVQALFGDDDTVTTTLTHNRRVSFGRKVIKEFLVGSAVSTQAVHEYEQSSESVSETSDCSGPLDLALNKTCRDFETEVEAASQVITPPESFSDSKAKAPEQRARLFTENCINIAKSVFQDTETELTAIIIGAKPTVGDDDRRNSSCMSCTTLEVSQDYGQRALHDFIPMRHPELMHPDQNHAMDKGRYEFLDHSIGSSMLGPAAAAKPVRQAPRTPLAPISRASLWEAENDENIPPAHSSFRQASTPAHKFNTSEMTMEFTCANLAMNRKQAIVNCPERDASQIDSDMDETYKNSVAEKTLNLSRANVMWETSACEEADPLHIDAPGDDFLEAVVAEDNDKSTSDDSDIPFESIQRELANLSNVNQSFREKLQTLPGLLNISSASGLNVTTALTGDDSNLSFLQTTASEEIKPQDDADKINPPESPSKPAETTVGNIGEWRDEPDPLGGILTPRKGNISIFDEDSIDENKEENSVDMEFTHCNVVKRNDVNNTVTNEPLVTELTDEADSGNTMEFTRCNLLRKSTVNILSESVNAEQTEASESLMETEDVEPFDATKTNLLENDEDCEGSGEKQSVGVDSSPTLDRSTEGIQENLEESVDSPKVAEEYTGEVVTKIPELTMELENDATMDFTNVNMPAREEPQITECDAAGGFVENIDPEILAEPAKENIDDTLPVEVEAAAEVDSVQSEIEAVSAPEMVENVTQVNTTVATDTPLETPITGLAALSVMPSLKKQLQTAQPNSTCSEPSIEEGLRSLEISEGSIGGVLPKPMKTMSEEQHMKAIHESTRVIEATSDNTYTVQLPKENTYTLSKPQEATFTISRNLNVSEAASKRNHSDSPCVGERLKKTRTSQSPLVYDSFGKRMHSDSPLPDQSLLKKSRVSDVPRVARSLCLTDESFRPACGAESNLDVSISLADITLSQTEKSVLLTSCSFGILPMSQPERSTVPDEMEMSDVTVPVMSVCAGQDSITTNMPIVTMTLFHDDEQDEQNVSSATNLDRSEWAESGLGTPTASCLVETSEMSIVVPTGSIHDTTSPDSMEQIVKNVRAALQQQSNEASCVWKLLKFDETEGLIQVELPLLAIGLELSLTYSDDSITNLQISRRTAVGYQRAFKEQVNEYGFLSLRQYILKNEKKIRNLEDVPHYLDFFNCYTVKLNSVMNDALIVLHGCAGSRLCGDLLSFRLYSYPSLISCWVDLNLTDLLLLGQPAVQFRHETGRLNEQQFRDILTGVKQPLLQNFVREAVSFIIEEEQQSGFMTKRPPLLF